MGKLKNRPFEECVYKHCNNVFRPKREAQRFCSQRCREAYRYDQKLLKQGGRERLEARKRRLGPGALKSAEKAGESATKTVIYREGVSLVRASHSIETPSTSDIDPELLTDRSATTTGPGDEAPSPKQELTPKAINPD
jgi:hypothetical protein